ncbi:hypothetical protein C499_15535 [Halogeometricum borinquense DSM 11551]|uniref:Uncharacterized protein n=1 Tax=Halogeometricum borinquense (strain ATCC 700274 / DSM 11551 / JCM 10706 / KCTC 4070 / PR3) TaxID=469382 RepID=E4NSP0_HALBP|nr:hypothetical protein [Halogeometricum borinquense]ADQ68133.1 hypothetical protein Hbor_25800 [Halogeometricum borinquense DSM 11551]ELY24823.1 hypothetical protein C499_15535 [Halogeometricum borinquense DSM 11551]
MRSNRSSRRRVLAVAGTIGVSAVSGCTNRISTLADDLGSNSSRQSNATITFRLTGRTSTLRERYVKDLNETRVPWDEDALAAAVNGTPYTTQFTEPFVTREPTWAKHNGTYYHLDEVVVGEEKVTQPVLRLRDEGRIENGEADAPKHVEKGTLPESDQKAVEVAYMAARARGNIGGVPWGLVQRGGYVYRNAETAKASELLDGDGPDYVAYRGHVWQVETQRETFYEAVYRPDVEPVAETADEIEEVLRGRLVGARIDPESLSQSERDVFREAQNGYTAEHPFPEAFVSILKRLDERAYIDGNVTKDAGTQDYPEHDVIRYGDEYFEYRLRLDEASEK